jgi:uridine kinase
MIILAATSSAVYVLTCHYRKRTEIPIYSFAKHSRLENTTSIYSPHVLVVEGIFALHDPRVLKLLDMKV